jgi:hypothetical protein
MVVLDMKVVRAGGTLIGECQWQFLDLVHCCLPVAVLTWRVAVLELVGWWLKKHAPSQDVSQVPR